MKSSQRSLPQLLQDRDAIVKSGRLHWFHWAIISLSLVVTLGAWYFTKEQVEEKAANQFQRATDQALELISERMQKYEDGLWAGVAAIQAHGGEITYEDWRVFAQSLRIELKYPGINGIGVIHSVSPENLETYLENQRSSRPDYRIHPEHDKREYLPITYIEPSAANARAVGLDMAHETNRYSATIKARDTGTAQITGPIVLVQDEDRTPGFLFYAPYYTGGTQDSLLDRRSHFAGMVYAPFVFHKLMDGVLDKDRRQIRLRISDNADILYDELTDKDRESDQNPLFGAEVDLDVYGRTWRFDIKTTNSFRDAVASGKPVIILVGGLSLDFLLFTLFVLLSKASRRAVNFADQMTHELQKKAKALENSNAELEKFAYVTSHDLKTPLRGICNLTDCLEEDLQAYINGPNANPDVKKNIHRLHVQGRRMDGLIRGILEYSSVGTFPKKVAKVDSTDIVTALQAELDLRDDQIILEGSLPVLTTDVVQFEQVIANLMGNAVKYHHDPDQALVTIGIEETKDFYVFSIGDNGPGIDPRFHSKIFDIFQTLHSRDEMESTGIGLSIVKKAVESHGGSVSICSEEGKGAKFTFEWRKNVEVQLQRSSRDSRV